MEIEVRMQLWLKLVPSFLATAGLFQTLIGSAEGVWG
jgi:hypothetical protein